MATILKAIRAKLGNQHGFVKSVGTLVGGTAFAQVLAVLLLPILTRLYTPADFSVLAVYASLLALLSAVACSRLEIAIPMPERDEDAANLLALALVSSAIFSIVIGCVIVFFPEQVIHGLGSPVFEPYLWMVPIGTWAASSYAAIQYWATRKKRFLQVAHTRMIQSLGGGGVQIGANWLIAGPFGLLFGHMISNCSGVFGLARQAWKKDGHTFRSVNGSSMREMLRQYSRFPKYSTLEALANSAGIQLPIIVIAALAIGPEAGYLMLAARVMTAPMGLIGGSVAQVYLAHAPEELRAGNLEGFTQRVLQSLSITGVGPLIFAGITAPPVFSLVFGAEWRRAGELVSWMTPWFVLQFMSSPVSMVMHVTNRQRAMLAVTISGLVIRLGAMGGAYLFFREKFSEFYACSGAVFYFICCAVFYKAAGIGPQSFREVLAKAAIPVAAWIGLGAVVRMAMEAMK